MVSNVVLTIIYSDLQVREMVEIITREFIQMASSAGEVKTATHLHQLMLLGKRKLKHLHVSFASPDGARASQNPAQIHADDELGVTARYF